MLPDDVTFTSTPVAPAGTPACPVTCTVRRSLAAMIAVVVVSRSVWPETGVNLDPVVAVVK